MDNHLILDHLLNNIPECIFWKDRSGVIQGCNKAFANVVGFDDVKDVIGKTDYDFDWFEELSTKYVSDDQEIINSGKPKISYVEPHKRPDGSIKTLLVNKVPLRDQNQNIIGILGTCLDITELEQERNKRAAAEEGMKQMRILASTISHDVKNPISVIAHTVEIVQNGLKTLLDTYQIAQKAHLLKDTIDQAELDLIKDMPAYFAYYTKLANSIIDMTLANLKEHTNKNAWQTISISTILQEYYERYPFKKGDKQLVHIASDMDFKVRGEPAALINIFNNLTANSLYFIAAAGKGEVFISFSTTDQFNCVHFKDTGKGCAKAELDKIFEGFYSTRDGGTGLGLPSCKRIMQELGGDIKAKSKPGEYMELVLYFPKL